VKGLRTFVLDEKANPGRANLYAYEGRTVVIDYAHNEAGIRGLTEILRGLRPRGASIWLTIGTAGDRTDDILHAFALYAALGCDHLAFAELEHYLRGRTREDIVTRLGEGAAEAGVFDVPVYANELAALKATLAASAPGDVVSATVLAMRPEVFRWLKRRGARPLRHPDVKRLARAAVAEPRTA